MRFLVDAQLPPALARTLAAAGHEAYHVADVRLAGASDEAIWQRAIEIDAVVVTKDADFSRICVLSDGPAVVWIRRPNTRRRALLDWFEPLLPDIIAAIDRGERLIEVI